MQRHSVAGEVLGEGALWMWLVMVALEMPVMRGVQAMRQLMVRLVGQPWWIGPQWRGCC